MRNIPFVLLALCLNCCGAGPIQDAKDAAAASSDLRGYACERLTALAAFNPELLPAKQACDAGSELAIVLAKAAGKTACSVAHDAAAP